MRWRLFDFLSLAAALALVGLFSAYAYQDHGSGSQLEISSPQGRWLYPLDREARVSIQGPLGRTEVAIEGGRARVLDSPCPEKLCIAAGAVSLPGAWIACLPNQVFLRVLGNDEKIDAISF